MCLTSFPGADFLSPERDALGAVGGLLEDGDVVLLDPDSQDLDEGFIVELAIHVESPDLHDDEKSEIYVDVPEKYRKGNFGLNGKYPDTDIFSMTPRRHRFESKTRDLTVTLLFYPEAKENLKDDAIPVTIPPMRQPR